jgi:hypothetical protein
MELIYSFNINKQQTENYCKQFGYNGSTTDELMEFYNMLLMTHVFTWNGFSEINDENGNPIYSYTYNEDV